MKLTILPFVLAAAVATPAVAADMTCAQFASLDSGQQIEVIDTYEPKSVEDEAGQPKAGQTASPQGSSGKDGTVDPNMLESKKVEAVLGACDNAPDRSVAEAMKVAFKK